MGGTSREYLIGRLRKEGHFALLAAVERGDLSAYAAACEVGFCTRKPNLDVGSQNMLRRRMFAIRNAYRDVDAQPPQDNGLASNESRPAAKDNPASTLRMQSFSSASSSASFVFLVRSAQPY